MKKKNKSIKQFLKEDFDKFIKVIDKFTESKFIKVITKSKIFLFIIVTGSILFFSQVFFGFSLAGFYEQQSEVLSHLDFNEKIKYIYRNGSKILLGLCLAWWGFSSGDKWADKKFSKGGKKKNKKRRSRNYRYLKFLSVFIHKIYILLTLNSFVIITWAYPVT